MMDQLKIQLRKPSPEGELYPYYDNESGVLEVSSRVPQSWPYGVDIDGTVIFDLNQNGIIGNFDLLIARDYWKPGRPVVIPNRSYKANIGFKSETLKKKSFCLPVESFFDKQKNLVSLMFSTKKEGFRLYELSKKCLALVEGNCLAGFLIYL